MDPTELLPVVAVLALITVEYGGWALLTFITGREGLSDDGRQFFRAGHAHAGVLLLLSLVYFLYLERTDLSVGWQWAAGGLLLAGILAQSGGFFLHLAAGAPRRPSAGTKVTRTGALVMAVAFGLLVVGLL